ncbi:MULTISPECIES: hypothetical protein [unclassified Helicobacter]|uniref:hypothetical protein n=1 Tax=unclassified Helicobacter TaxID=2593540 RepID=UPI0015F1B219|nr:MULTISPECIES: hypothetical protein [unclassified Helicobacter]
MEHELFQQSIPPPHNPKNLLQILFFRIFLFGLTPLRFSMFCFLQGGQGGLN